MLALIVRSRADILLLLVAGAWGSTYLVAKELTTERSVIAHLAVRMLAAALAMGLLLAGSRRRLSRAELHVGGVLGILLASVFVCETFGIVHTSATNAGLLISLTVVITPLLESLVARRWLPAPFFAAAAVAIVGVTLLAGGGALRPPSLGDALILLAAVVRAVHVVSMSRLTAGRQMDSVNVTTVQLATCALVFLAASVVGGVFGAGSSGGDVTVAAYIASLSVGGWMLMLYLVVVCTVFAFLVQTWAVRRTSPSRVSLLLGTEPVWAAAVGVLIARDPVSPLGYAGIALILVGTAWGRRIEAARR